LPLTNGQKEPAGGAGSSVMLGLMVSVMVTRRNGIRRPSLGSPKAGKSLMGRLTTMKLRLNR